MTALRPATISGCRRAAAVDRHGCQHHEGLRDVLVDALPRNAAGVLRAIGDRQTSEFFKEGSCFPPEDATGQAARDYIATATRAVEAVTDPALKAAKTQCLANLRQAPA
jgi:hypothetical protein